MEYDFPSFDAIPGKPFVAAADPGGVGTALAQLSERIEPPAPATPPSSIVRLPFGLLRDGVAVRDAQVRELTGADEEALAGVAGSPLRYLETLLLRGTVAVGSEPSSQALMRELTLADRDALLVAIRCATYGPELKIDAMRCPHCGGLTDLVVHLDDLDDPQPPDPTVRTFEVELRRGHALVRQPTGADQMQLEGKSLSAAATNSVVIGRCLLKVVRDGEQIPGSPALAKDLGMADRIRILQAIDHRRYGPRFDQVSLTHEACGQEVRIPLVAGDLFQG